MSAPKALTKTQVLAALAEQTDLTRDQVRDVLDALGGLIASNLQEGAPGVLNLPGLMKVKVQRKPATPERMGIDPFTKQERMFAAKPARNIVKIQPLKALKDLVDPQDG